MKTNALWYYGLLMADFVFFILLLFGDQPAFWRAIFGWTSRNQSPHLSGYGMYGRKPMNSTAPFDFNALMENRDSMLHNTLAEWREEYFYLKSENSYFRSFWGLHNYWAVIIKLYGLLLVVLYLYCWRTGKINLFAF